jgi:outer membrane protein assembly factor BamB
MRHLVTGRTSLLVVQLGVLLLLSACTSDAPSLRRADTPRDAPEEEPTSEEAEAPRINWPSFLLNPRHSSFNKKATAITRDNVTDLAEAWTWNPDPPTQSGQPPAQLYSSPTVFDGRIYIGANTGDFYALDEDTGSVIWKQSFGYLEKSETCGARGLTSTATVANDPVSDRPIVYVAAADGFLYALDTEDGSEVWKSFVVETPNMGHNWSSPTVVDGRIYMGVASHCKSVLRGGVKEFDQATGELLKTNHTVPEGVVGGSVWSSAAVNAAGDVFVSTGNADPETTKIGESYSIIRLNGKTLAREDIWTAPLVGTDLDFGGSPTLFSSDDGTEMVGACNKDGNYYALEQARLSAGPVWIARISGKWPAEGNCLAAAIWDSDRQRLFIAGAQTTIDGTAYRGSIRRLDPATGEFIWETGLPSVAWGSPTMNGAGVIAVGGFDTDPEAENGAFLVNSNNGEILATVADGSRIFAQPVFADPYLFIATQGEGLIAYTPSSEG